MQQPNVGHFTCSAGDASRTRFVNAQISQPLVRTFQSLPAVLDQPFLAGCFALGPVAQDVRLAKEGTVSAPNWMADQFCSERPALGAHAVLMQCSSLKQGAGGTYNCLIANEKPSSYLQRFTVSVMSVSSVQCPLPSLLVVSTIGIAGCREIMHHTNSVPFCVTGRPLESGADRSLQRGEPPEER